MKQPLPFFTLLLLISFASVNAVLFTPALPAIARYFSVSDNIAQGTITWFLVGYSLGQLLYGPYANRYGRKPTLYIGITLQIISSLLCILAGLLHQFSLLIVARFLLALGSGVGLKMTFTLVNENYNPKTASQKISYLILAFAITPGVAVALGGFLNSHYGWMSTFAAGAVYGLLMLALVSKLPETAPKLDPDALKLSHLIPAYLEQFRNKRLIAGGLLMGASTAFVYVFSAVAPFIAISLHKMSSAEYGLANLLPPIGLLLGSLLSARLIIHYSLKTLIKTGIGIASVGVIAMYLATYLQFPLLISLFGTVILIYFGLCFIIANGSSLAMSDVQDKSHGSAVMSFLNMGIATLVTLSIGLFTVRTMLLPTVFLFLCIFMLILIAYFKREAHE